MPQDVKSKRLKKWLISNEALNRGTLNDYPLWSREYYPEVVCPTFVGEDIVYSYTKV